MVQFRLPCFPRITALPALYPNLTDLQKCFGIWKSKKIHIKPISLLFYLKVKGTSIKNKYHSLLYADGNIHLEMIDKPYSKGREPSGSCSVLPQEEMRCHIHGPLRKGWWDTLCQALSALGRSRHFLGALQRWQICCHALARGLGRRPCTSPMGGPAL